MKSFKKIFLMLTSFAMVVGTLLIGGGIKKTEMVEAATQTDSITMNGFGSDPSKTSYVSNLETGTSKNGLKVSAHNYIPSTGQVKGNKTSANDNFYIYNNDPTLGSITKVELIIDDASTSGYFKAAASISVGKESQSSASSGNLGTLTDSHTITWNIGETLGCRYFKILSSAKFTNGNVKNAVINIEYYVAEKYTVSYVTNGGKLSTGETQINDATATDNSLLVNPGDLTHSDDETKKFMGWYYTDSNGVSQKWDFDKDTVNSDLELTAKWGYEVTINPDNGGDVVTETVLEGTNLKDYVLTNINEPKNDGYSFVEWRVNNTAIGDGDLVNSKVEVKAFWKKVITPYALISTVTNTYYVYDTIEVNAEISNVPEGDQFELNWTIIDDGNVLKDETNSSTTKLVLNAIKAGEVLIEVELVYNGQSYVNKDNNLDIIVLDHPIKNVITESWLGLSYIGNADTKNIGFFSGENYNGPSAGGTGNANKVIDISEAFELKNSDSTNTSSSALIKIEYCTNGKSAAFYKPSEIRLYKNNTNGSSLKFNALDGYIIKSISFNASGLSVLDINGDTLGTTDSINSNFVEIKNKQSGSSGNIKITDIQIVLEKMDVKFTSIRARFGITIPADMYQFDKITSENVSFKVYVNEAENPTVVKMTDANKTINEDKSITYVVSVVNIPLANCKDVIHVVPTITINGHSYELAGTAYSVYQMVDAYLAQDAFKDNAYLTALKASIDAATNVA